MNRNIKTGDMVTVHMAVTDAHNGQLQLKLAGRETAGPRFACNAAAVIWADDPAIVAHYRLISVGDTVQYRVQHSNVSVPGKGKVLSIHDGRAWVMFESRSVPLSPLLTSLERVN